MSEGHIHTPGKAEHRKPASIVPASGIAGRTLMLLIAIMTFLSCVTFGAVVLVQKSAQGWSSDVASEVSILVRPIEGEVMESNLRTVVSLAEATPGVASAHAMSEDESEKLLEPWLGSGLDLSSLNIPRLVVVQLSDPAEADLQKLQQDLKSVNGASLDTHAAWRQQLNVMAGTMVISGLFVLALIITATILAVVFATRGTMASNQEIVDVLHFIGASNSFVAGEFQGRFMRIGLNGGVIGGAAALAFFIITSMVVSTVLPQASSAQITILFGRFSLGWQGLVGIVLIVPFIAILTAITSRMTVRRFLSQLSQ